MLNQMSSLRLGSGAEGMAPRIPDVDLVVAARDICQCLVESVEALSSDITGGGPDHRSQTNGISAS
jgi:hypothetical protein